MESGRTYLVGERGPEIFVPDSSGMIIPNHAVAGPGFTGEPPKENESFNIAEPIADVKQSGSELIECVSDMSRAVTSSQTAVLVTMRELIAMQTQQAREVEELRAYVRNGR